MKYYALCGFGGILSCGLTHTALVPLDLVKCRIQVRRTVKTDLCVSVVLENRGHCFTEQNGMEHSEQLCKSSLQCLISMSCISLDGVHRALHTGTLVAQNLVSGKNWMCKHESRSIDNRGGTIWQKLA